MLEFKKMDRSDYDILSEYFKKDNTRRRNEGIDMICDQVFGTTYMWRNYYNIRYALYSGSAILMASAGGADMFSFPMGGDVTAALREIRDYSHSIGMAVYFCFISESDLHYFYDVFDVVFPSEERDWFDYVYDKRSITDYAGRHMHGQRNFYNRYKKKNPDGKFTIINGTSAASLIEYADEWFEKYSDNSEMSGMEKLAIHELLSDWDDFNMSGGYITSSEGIAGFTIGETVGNTVFIHVEKAEQRLAGAYQFLSSEYLRSITNPEIRFVNREEDMGLPGLRSAKEALHPEKMLKKYTLYCC